MASGSGYVFEMAREGKTIGVMMYEPLMQSSDTAFAAYTSAEPTVAFLGSFSRHLARLDEFEKRAGFPREEELLRQRFFTLMLALAKLYASQGHSQPRRTKELDLATATGFMHPHRQEGRLIRRFPHSTAARFHDGSNHAMERTAARYASTFEMSPSLALRPTRALVRRRSSCSR